MADKGEGDVDDRKITIIILSTPIALPYACIFIVSYHCMAAKGSGMRSNLHSHFTPPSIPCFWLIWCKTVKQVSLLKLHLANHLMTL